MDATAVCTAIRKEVLLLGHQGYVDDGTTVHLPMRPDAKSYLLDCLCRDGKAPLATASLAFPQVSLDDDGTISLGWTVAENFLLLNIPCPGILYAHCWTPSRGLSIELTFRDLNPNQLTCELNSLFDWLKKTDPETH